jgi:hypothetical protein
MEIIQFKSGIYSLINQIENVELLNKYIFINFPQQRPKTFMHSRIPPLKRPFQPTINRLSVISVFSAITT